MIDNLRVFGFARVREELLVGLNVAKFVIRIWYLNTQQTLCKSQVFA